MSSIKKITLIMSLDTYLDLGVETTNLFLKKPAFEIWVVELDICIHSAWKM